MRTTVSLVGAVALLLGPSLASASVIVSLNNPGSMTLHEIEVAPGNTFCVDVNFDVSTSAYMVWFALQASESGIFEVAAVSDTLPWSTVEPSQMLGVLQPESGIWRTNRSGPAIYGEPGVTSAGMIQVALGQLAPPGDYTISIVRAEYFETPFVGMLPAIAGPDFTIHVPVPESGTIVLLSAALLFIGRSR